MKWLRLIGNQLFRARIQPKRAWLAPVCYRVATLPQGGSCLARALARVGAVKVARA